MNFRPEIVEILKIWMIKAEKVEKLQNPHLKHRNFTCYKKLCILNLKSTFKNAISQAFNFTNCNRLMHFLVLLLTLMKKICTLKCTNSSSITQQFSTFILHFYRNP